jgi:hypothetical protein
MERMKEVAVAENERQKRRRVPHQVPGSSVRTVIQIPGGPQDAGSQLFVDIRVIVDHPRNRAYRDARPAGDVSDCCGHVAWSGATRLAREPFHQILCCGTVPPESIADFRN